MEPTLGEEPGVPGPQGRQPGDGSAEMLGDGVVLGVAVGEEKLIGRIGPTWGGLLKWWYPHFTPQNDHV